MLKWTNLGSLQFVHGNDLDKEPSAREKKVEVDYLDKFLLAMQNGSEFPPAPNKKQYEIWDKNFPKRISQDLSQTIWTSVNLPTVLAHLPLPSIWNSYIVCSLYCQLNFVTVLCPLTNRFTASKQNPSRCLAMHTCIADLVFKLCQKYKISFLQTSFKLTEPVANSFPQRLVPSHFVPIFLSSNFPSIQSLQSLWF